MLSSHNPEILYYGANKLFRSFDKGNTWSAISKDLTQSLKYGDVPYATITSISESHLQFGRLVVGTDDGMVWVTSDGGQKWRNVSKSLPKNLWVSRVVASKYDKNTLWLAMNNYRNDDIQSYLYRSKDFGQSWQSIAKGLPNEAVNVIKEDPSMADLIYVGTDKGVYVSFDAGKQWTTLGQSLPAVPVHDLVVHPRDHDLVIATHGRSMYITDISVLHRFADWRKKSLAVLPVDDMKFNKAWNSKPSRWFNTGEPKKTTFVFWSDAEKSLNIDIKDDNQQVIYNTQLNAEKGLNYWHWDHLLDRDKAMQAEQHRNRDKHKPLNKSLTPVSEGIRLGHDIYIQKGEYSLEVSNEDDLQK